MITEVLGFRLDFTGKKCSDLNFVNRNVIVDEAAVVFVFETTLISMRPLPQDKDIPAEIKLM